LLNPVQPGNRLGDTCAGGGAQHVAEVQLAAVLVSAGRCTGFGNAAVTEVASGIAVDPVAGRARYGTRAFADVELFAEVGVAAYESSSRNR
jgi:hypothetical protein